MRLVIRRHTGAVAVLVVGPRGNVETVCEGPLVLESDLINLIANGTVADSGQGVDPRRNFGVGSRLAEGFAVGGQFPRDKKRLL
jgi:hypothetical protein